MTSGRSIVSTEQAHRGVGWFVAALLTYPMGLALAVAAIVFLASVSDTSGWKAVTVASLAVLAGITGIVLLVLHWAVYYERWQEAIKDRE